MRLRSFLTASLGVALVSAAAAQTVTVTLDSSQDGMSVSPGATIDWTISFTVSGGDNAGLALLATDLVQDGGNPETLDIPPADAVPGPMSNFSRPDGISNPGESNPTTGYIGVQRGTAGAFDLIQIGGGQNIFGIAQAGGTGVAENANVVGGVGQSGAVTLASGSFLAPSTDGSYTFSLADAIANTLDAVNTPPAFSPASAATVDSSGGSFSFVVASGGGCGSACDVPGGDADVNDDCAVNITDLGVLLSNFGLTGGATHAQGDTNGDGNVNITDLGSLLSIFGANCP